MSAIRGFARYLSGMGLPAETPPAGLLGRRWERLQPYIYTTEEVKRILSQAWTLPSARGYAKRYGLKPWTLYTVVGLLAASGMRFGEVLKLREEDVDWNNGVLRIGVAKFLKSRLIPVHSTTLAKLRLYAGQRDRFFAACGRRAGSCFFVTSHGNSLTNRLLEHDFRILLQRAGIRELGAPRGPRLHDLRHRFAVVTLLRWYERGKNVESLLPVLAAYMGHSHVSGTFWYLSNTPELMAAAKKTT